MALTYRSVKGTALTITELDNNFRFFTGSHAVTGSFIAQYQRPITSSTSNFNLNSSNAGYFIYIGGAITCSIQPNSTEDIPIGTEYVICNTSSVTSLISSGSGVTILFGGSGFPTNLTTTSVITTKKIYGDTWVLASQAF